MVKLIIVKYKTFFGFWFYYEKLINGELIKIIKALKELKRKEKK